MRSRFFVGLLLSFPLSSMALAQDCGVWLPGPKPPDFPSGYVPQQFVTNGAEIFARASNPQGKVDLWRFDGHDWILLPWDRASMGEPDAITYENNQLAVASHRVVTDAQLHVETHVHTWDGSSWTHFGSFSNPYNISCAGTSLTLLDISFLSNAWYVSGTETGTCRAENVVLKIPPAGSTQIGAVTLSAARTPLETAFGAVYLGGSFSTVYNPTANIQINAANIARWTGTDWQPVLAGVDGEVVNMALWQENAAQPLSQQLVVAGKFTHAGGNPATGIAVYAGFVNSWSPLDGGVSWPPDLFGAIWRGPAPITPLPAVGNDVDLVVGGMFSAGSTAVQTFARWTGSAWESLGAGLNSAVNTAVTYNNQVVAGGGFSGEGVQGGEQLFGVGRFDGTHWHALSRDGTNGVVRALFTQSEVVYAGGDFTTMDGADASHIAARVNGQWQGLGGGTNGTVNAIASFGGEIVAGGSFSKAGGIPVQNVAAWNGSTWHTLGTGLDDTVENFTVFNNQLVAVGEFQTDDGQSTSLPGVAVWNGSAWVQLSDNVDATEAHAVTVHNGQLYLGGGFNGGVARFTGTQLEVVGGGVINGNVYALTSLAGSLYVGGDFQGVGNNQFIPWVARWTGSQWLALTNNGNSANFSGSVNTLIHSADELFVGGQFQVNTGKGPTTRNMARWNGVVWRTLADAFPDGRVQASTLAGDRLLAGGEFVQISNGTVSAYIAERSPSSALTLQPEPQHLCAGDGTETAVFEAAIVPDAGAQFRWQKNQVNVNDSLRIAGATTQTLSIFNVVSGDVGNYRLRVTDECGVEVFSGEVPLDFAGCCPGDMNNDHASNLVDASLFAGCLSGPQVSAPCQSATRADSDGDNDVDLRDAAAFQRSFGTQCP